MYVARAVRNQSTLHGPGVQRARRSRHRPISVLRRQLSEAALCRRWDGIGRLELRLPGLPAGRVEWAMGWMDGVVWFLAACAIVRAGLIHLGTAASLPLSFLPSPAPTPPPPSLSFRVPFRVVCAARGWILDFLFLSFFQLSSSILLSFHKDTPDRGL